MRAMMLRCGDGRELRMVRIPPGAVLVGRSDSADPVRCSLTKEFWIGESPITADDWHAVMGEECGRFDDGPGFAADMPWFGAREFCRILNDKNGDRIPDGYAVNLPTQAQWERSLDWMLPRAEIVGFDEPHATIGMSELMLYQSEIEGSPLTFVLGFDEMCLDAPLDEGCSSSANCIGPLRPDARSNRGVELCDDGSSVRVYRGYGSPGYGRIKWGGPGTGFRVGVHWQATGHASASSPQIVECSWGRTIVEGMQAHKDVKIYPGGGREWRWGETDTHHVPGVGIRDVMELVEWGAQHIVVGCGFHEMLRVTEELARWSADHGIALHAMNTGKAIEAYNDLAAAGAPAGALIHSTC